MALREDETAVAWALEEALRDGRVKGLICYPKATWEASPTDPPDIIVDLGHRIVGVELVRYVDQEYAATTTAMKKGKTGLNVWQPGPERAVAGAFLKKVAKYKVRNVTIEWLLIHDSLAQTPGFMEVDLIGHETIRKALAKELPTGPFEAVLLQTTFDYEFRWSVLYSR